VRSEARVGWLRLARMGSDSSDGDSAKDLFYGGLLDAQVWGGRALGRIVASVCVVRDTEMPDKVAVSKIVQSANGGRWKLRRLARIFETHNWHGDPLLEHVAHLVSAAANGSGPIPVADGDIETVRLERWLLSLSPADAFAELARRAPGLRALESKISDPGWQTAQSGAPTASLPPIYGYASGPPTVPAWLPKPLSDRARAAKETARLNDNEIQSDIRVIRVAQALMNDYGPLVGRHARTSDPLLSTIVAFKKGMSYLGPLAGLNDEDGSKDSDT
jgi:hypothetical protein